MFKPVSPNIDFPLLERDLLKKWYENGIVEKYLNRNNNSKEKFSFLDGPITANNPMGVHHAWGRTYKDFWQRFWNMRGRKQRFQNGFDEQGLWVEVEVEKELGLHTKRDIENLIPGNKFKSLEKFINLCKERVKKYSTIQTEQSKRLGYFMDWENSYHTSSDENNYAIWNFLKIVNEKGWLYKGRDSVPWCPRCGTAISQHEILTEEYKNLTHESVYFKLPIQDKRNEFLLVWTTTPWTIPANVAVAVNSEEKYGAYRIGDQIIWLMEKRFEVLRKNNDFKELKLESSKKGKDLVGLEYEAPFDNLPRVTNSLKNYSHRVVAGDERILPVGIEEGTGLVHVAPGAGAEDFQLGKKESLPVIEIIDEAANYLEDLGELSGKNAKKHPEIIIDFLKTTKNFFFATERYTHRYPTCWRCKTELVWRVVDEWYISMDKKDESGKTYREQMLEVAKKIEWLPKWGLDRELDWLKNMHDWLISKKRYWGLALPIWECQKCKSFEVIGDKKELEEKAVEGYDKFEGNSPHRPWIDQIRIRCSKCDGLTERISDVGNPWLDAGIVPFSTMPQDWFPADFITESFPGQFKNWFYSLIAMSTALKNKEPFKTVLGFASVRDEKGEEMHKSKGNAIEFNEAADKIGVDVMRWTYLRTNPEQNLNFGYHTADEIRRLFHLRLWNTFSFFLMYASVDKWVPVKSEFNPKHVLDRWILSRLNGSIKNITSKIEKYDAFGACEDAENFVINDLSNWYVRRIRDRVGPTAPDGQDKNDAYQTLWSVLVQYSKLLSPFIPFIAEEIYVNLTEEESVNLVDWPKQDELLIDKKLEEEMSLAREIVELTHSKRKEKNIKVRQPLGLLTVTTTISLSEEIKKIIVSEVNVKRIRDELKKDVSLSINLDTNITDELKQEGDAREIIRKIQHARKELGTKPDDFVDVTIESWPEKFEDYIKKKALIKTLVKGGEFAVEKA
ncbi:MAG: isoleucine--tRNA ligase [Patescibacteria group bacterium]|nr:isoleucine--tRNA ligase [Patescibacteria group bacterium]